MKSFHDSRVSLWDGDCREVLPGFERDAFDSCVCDPPYHLSSIVKRFGKEGSAPAQFGTDGAYARASRGFMGKVWDGGDVAFQPDTWRAVLRVLKPGAHLVAFSGSRTYHRMVCAIEDAGFEVRDTIAWMYGSGFPKSHDVSKALDRHLGAERSKTRTPMGPTGNKYAKGLGDDRPWMQEAAKNGYHEHEGSEPVSEIADAYDGWGTALKPAFEPIVLARKPLSESTIAANVLRWGTGAINVDGCRVEGHFESGWSKSGSKASENRAMSGANYARDPKPDNSSGRWPANVCTDGSEEVLAAFPETVSGLLQTHHQMRESDNVAMSGKNYARTPKQDSFGDSGSAARFFATFKEDNSAWNQEHARNAANSISLSSEAVVSVLSLAVEATTERWELQRASYRAASTPVTASELEQIETLVTATILSIEKRCSLGQPLEKLSLSSSHASIVAIQKPTGIITITIDLSKSNGRVERATFDITETSAVAGASASDRKRFWYGSKADSDDRLGSRHPTIKPVALLGWLCRLITPKGGHILDPFAGTGTTAEAALREGFRCTLIEREPEYLKDIERRMALVFEGETGRSVAMAKLEPEGEALPLFAPIQEAMF